MIGDVRGALVLVWRIAPADVEPTQSTQTHVIPKRTCEEAGWQGTIGMIHSGSPKHSKRMPATFDRLMHVQGVGRGAFLRVGSSPGRVQRTSCETHNETHNANEPAYAPARARTRAISSRLGPNIPGAAPPASRHKMESWPRWWML
jgi:hypothetical protein